jgi:hypothetical protein
MKDWAWPFIIFIYLVLGYFLGAFDKDSETRKAAQLQTLKYFAIGILALIVFDYFGAGTVDSDPIRPADIYNE